LCVAGFTKGLEISNVETRYGKELGNNLAKKTGGASFDAHVESAATTNE
jgi:hypothetical protein